MTALLGVSQRLRSAPFVSESSHFSSAAGSKVALEALDGLTIIATLSAVKAPSPAVDRWVDRSTQQGGRGLQSGYDRRSCFILYPLSTPAILQS